MTLLRKYEKLRMLVWVKTMADTIMATFIGPECNISPTSSLALDLTACKGNISNIVVVYTSDTSDTSDTSLPMYI